ncbi:MAG: hypothetical protein PHW45_02615 [Candidatus ainarchaeum sp.]|nr:hypothetical protein [Candidatus ainarchaeum sp.]MDD4221494.1 hypothetical protein [Candidatus ainarchaeum sp.]MDD4662701.1 hypothetical protein [Candidatus ainarchaeum sp.]
MNYIKKYSKWIDPFTYVDILLLKLFGKPKNLKVKILYWIFYILFSVLFAFLIYKLAGLILGTTLPFATVLSGSMEPNFYRGDIIVLNSAKNLKAETITLDYPIGNKDLQEFATQKFYTNQYGLTEVKSIAINNKTIEIKDIIKNKNSVVVYNSNTTGKDIIHRLVVIIKATDGTFILTKGDNSKTNRIIDQDCRIDQSTGLAQNFCLNLYPVKKENLIGKKKLRIPYLGYLKLIFFRG